MMKNQEKKFNKKITIYTDGAARGNPGPAGWAAIVFDGDKITELGGRSDHATNNQMELSAPIGGLKHIISEITSDVSSDREVEIFSDSKYVIKGITEWIYNWQKNGWRNAAKKPVVNKELWEELYALTQNIKVKWTYVEGHSGDKYNDRADEIATSYADELEIDLRKE